jgi:hypothetical protein
MYRSLYFLLAVLLSGCMGETIDAGSNEGGAALGLSSTVAACSGVPACGGNPVGTWQVTAGCFEFPAPPLCPAILTPYGDGDGGPEGYNVTLNGPLFGALQGTVQGGTLAIGGDGTISFNDPVVSYEGRAHFPPPCLQNGGPVLSCDMLGSLLYAQTQCGGTGCAADGGFANSPVACKVAADGGCDCEYSYGNLAPQAGNSGNWVRLGDSTLQVNQGWEFDFCAAPDRLDISGYSGNEPSSIGSLGLLDVPGLQTLSFAKVSNAASTGGAPQSTNAVEPQTVTSEACPSTTGCGGDPTGTWRSTSVCLDSPPPTPPGQPCEDLVYVAPDGGGQGRTQIEYVNLPVGPGAVTLGATVSFQADGTYNLAITTTQLNQAHFAPYCLTAWGANPSCDDLQTQLQQSFFAMPTWQNFACSVPADGGCDCSYAYLANPADLGTWNVEGTTLTLRSALAASSFAQFTFCRTAGGLQMTTMPGSTLLGLGPGAMTLMPGP